MDSEDDRSLQFEQAALAAARSALGNEDDYL